MKRSVMIVDDEPEIRDLIRSCLRRVDPDLLVVESADGSDALNKAQLQHFHLVVTDLKMPRRTGDCLLRSLHALSKNFRPNEYLVVSGHLEPDTHPDLEGKVTYMRKPFSLHELSAYFTRCLKAKTDPRRLNQLGIDTLGALVGGTGEAFAQATGSVAVRQGLPLTIEGSVQGDYCAAAVFQVAEISVSAVLSLSESAHQKLLPAEHSSTASQKTPPQPGTDVSSSLFMNIISSARRDLGRKGIKLGPALPTTSQGLGHHVQHGIAGQGVSVSFDSEFGNFAISIITLPATHLQDASHPPHP